MVAVLVKPNRSDPDCIGQSGKGIGQSARRKEDARFLSGDGQFVGDLKFPNMQDVAFVRSPLAHGTIVGIDIPALHRDSVYCANDLGDVQPICAVSALKGFKPSAQPVLATGKVRYVGELLAACLGNTRAEAEDVADEVYADIEELPVVVDMLEGRKVDAPLVHDEWGDNVFLETEVSVAEPEIVHEAPIKVTRRLRMSRQCMAPLEGRGVLAFWDSRASQLIVYTSTQIPHIVRTGLAECLGLEEATIRVIAPDVGGGFGYKGLLLPEEVIVCWLAIKLGRPIRWLEDRREALTAAANAREHHYDITLTADGQGKLVSLDAEVHVDAGAYSAYPFTACLEAAQVASILPGPYNIPVYSCKTWSVATNKCGILPYRGVARAGVCYALESMLDLVARATKKEPFEVRLANLVTPDQMPFDNITNKHFDSGNYPECLSKVVEAIDLPSVRTQQRNAAQSKVLLGVGIGIYNEQAAHGTAVYSGWGIPMIPGYEQAFVRLTPDGGLEIRVGIQCHGQGTETTLAQIAQEILGISIESIKVVHGDTALSPYSTGTWGSRVIVMAGGAVANACDSLSDRLRKVGAHLLQSEDADTYVDNGMIIAPSGEVSIKDVAKTWYRRPQDLPNDVDPSGLEVTAGYKMERDDGTFSYAAHAVVVSVDTELGNVDILKYAIVEDGGTLINPMIVDGQVCGGAAQGIGTALYEEMPFDQNGQPTASTLAEYILPGATEVPNIEVQHMETPSPYSRFGQKGIGEGGAIGSVAAIANAVNDALIPLGAEVRETPISPRRILEAIKNATTNRDKGS